MLRRIAHLQVILQGIAQLRHFFLALCLQHLVNVPLKLQQAAACSVRLLMKGADKI